ncbi:MAG: ROK family protein [Verrucomicrobiota bacterium]|nr:ROK family protein [Verrucomicrobiota bacterium]
MYLGIEIGGTKLQLVLGNESAEIIQRVRLNVERSKGGEGIRYQISSALPGLLEGKLLKGVGVGFGGPVNWQTGKIACSHQIEGWSEFPISEWLFELTKAPVRVDNDANTAALAEALLGSGIGFNPVFYITMGSGVGGGLVVENRIYHGAVPGEAEIGHLRLGKDGRILEESCSGWAVDRKIREALASRENSLLKTLVTAEGGEARHLATAVQRADPVAMRILQETCDDLAFGLSHVIHLCHPQSVVLGGGLSLMGELLVSTVERFLANYLMEAFYPGPRIALAKLGEDVVPRGALLLAREAGEAHKQVSVHR